MKYLKRLYYKLLGKKYVENLIIVNSVQRNGTHALSNWILHQTNNEIDSPIPLEHIHGDVYRSDNNLFVNSTSIDNLHNQLEIVNNNFKNGSSIIFVHEKPVFLKPEQYKLNHINKIEIIGIRDPFNSFASCFYGFGTVHSHIMQDWKALAKKALTDDYHVLLYNEWFKNRQYRQDFCKRTGLKFNDISKNVVPNFGGGSSFEKMGFREEAEKMRVLERFKTFEKNKTFCDIFLKNKEIVELSDELFGIIECTNSFRNKNG